MAALATSRDLVDGDYLRERGFWDTHGTGVLFGLPWRASFGRSAGVAPELGRHTDAVLGHLLGVSPAEMPRCESRCIRMGMVSGWRQSR